MPANDYTLTRRRMKNIRMTVRAGTGEVRVSAPLRTPRRVIDAWVESKAEWIELQRSKALAAPAPLAPGPEADALRRELRPVLAELVAAWVPRMGVPEPTWRVRIMRSRWGSCNKDARSLNFSLELARKDRHLVEYVVVHELAHLIESNHGPGFYAVMDAHLPDWKSRRAELNGR
ncbi:SprT family zinc-dependent metalloprotease [Demequina sp. SYSU T00039]|uniref:SprT family zinc-dependent metalloprotease n=1 Tax=Demequina lignilytica TaxID=3051663 RepID=A0AAW7M4F0_9MICO|nr:MULTISPECIES: SprT family zinc-dependent metalloprotease [unclassified Demequina]MDN4478881.1 SprT family zinc-dependent metalloprotease [Demequina sp. SYSU T00039-1]MDN4488979.1 SprT family zinc-dependent metalloprotease [Demequina sp. SYSU T00039]MDN4490399.1 SprT family zinc-dependent metalloprotease [Demequina sp. SYSU T00068]